MIISEIERRCIEKFLACFDSCESNKRVYFDTCLECKMQKSYIYSNNLLFTVLTDIVNISSDYDKYGISIVFERLLCTQVHYIMPKGVAPENMIYCTKEPNHP